MTNDEGNPNDKRRIQINHGWTRMLKKEQQSQQVIRAQAVS
jgi:hypothetical protein